MKKHGVYLTKEEVQDTIGKHRWPEFVEWFSGQTGMIAEDGTLLYYAWDVDRFKRGLQAYD